MSGYDSSDHGDPSLQVRAEAAAWLAILGSPSRTPELEERFGHWLAECEPHRIAWERVSDAWDLAGGLSAKIAPGDEVPQREPRRRGTSRRRGLLALAAAASLAVAAAGVFLLSTRGTFSTGVGERRVVSLQDGTRITLNTRSRISVQYDREARRVRLESGEALFEVRRDPRWPFIVTAGTRQILALGTAFEVRRYGTQQVAITLVEGRISIAPAGAGVQPPSGEVTVLASPGQRLTFAPHEAPRLDRPVLGEVIAWQNGEVVFDRTRLSDAVTEMNRYSERRIVIVDPGTAALEVSGLFQAGDSTQFAAGVAATFGLAVEDDGKRILLVGQPRVSTPNR
jgi:transmembrane sensor